MNALDYAKSGAETLMRKFTPELLPPAMRFHYHQGVYLSGVERVWLLSGDEKYYNYFKEWVDLFIDENGKMKDEVDQFDDMQPAILLFELYKKTGDERYKTVLDTFAPIVDRWPTNAYGGFWHKYQHPNQMWLDGLYMIGPYMAQYAKEFDRPYFFETTYRQMELMRVNMTDPKTGLLYHAWDDSKQTKWADPATGCSPEFWGRAIGWYTVAILDILEFMPEDNPHRQALINAELDILHALIRYQDPKDGRWFQVVNRTDDPENWHENSCSSLFAYSISKAVRMGILDNSYLTYATKAYEAVIGSLTWEGDDLILPSICVGTGVGGYQFYLKRPTVQNDLHGMGAFLLMCTEYYAAQQAVNGNK